MTCWVCGEICTAHVGGACPTCRNTLRKPQPFETKDSGQREKYPSGAMRDTEEGKPRYDLIPGLPLKRLAELYARGAKKYGDWNWSQGVPSSRCYSSALRHLMQYNLGEKDEDHLAAVVFNVFCLMYFEDTEPKIIPEKT